MYNNVQAAQKAIQLFDGSVALGGSKPITVEMWVSKEDKEKERKRREEHQTQQIINALCKSQFGDFIGGGYHNPRPYTQGGQPGAPQGGNQQYQPRGGMPNRGGQRGGRGGRGNFSGGQRGGFAHGPRQPGQYQQQQQTQPQAPPQPIFQGLDLPLLNIADLAAISNPDERKQFVGNHIYPIIEGHYGNALAGRITGMLLDENVIDFTKLLTNSAYFTQKSAEANTLLLQAAQGVAPTQTQ